MARGTPQDTRRQDSLKVVMRVIGMLVKGSIEDYLAHGKEQILKSIIAKLRPVNQKISSIQQGYE
jgi:hypothetical protein